MGHDVLIFSAIAHMIRDGFPALKSTHAARLAGGVVVFLGLWIITGWLVAAVLALAVTVGFYTDMQHGEANKGDWTAGIISGCTSLAPIVVAAAGLHMSPLWLIGIVIGVVKPLIWQLAWWLDPGRYADRVPKWAAPLTEPTRVAAIIWGAIVGAFLIVTVQHG